MARITWDALGERLYELGCDRGVFYKVFEDAYSLGVPWNGLTGVEDSSGGRDATILYSGGVKAGAEYTSEEYSGKIKCFVFPDEFEEFLGERQLQAGVYARQQERDMFAFCYRTFVGNDVDGLEHGYKLHLIYNMRVTDLSRSYSTINDSNDVPQTDVSFETFPQEMDEFDCDPVSEIILDSRFLSAFQLGNIEDVLYGDENSPARLPFPEEIIEILNIPEPVPPVVLYPSSDLYPALTLYPVAEE